MFDDTNWRKGLATRDLFEDRGKLVWTKYALRLAFRILTTLESFLVGTSFSPADLGRCSTPQLTESMDNRLHTGDVLPE